MRIRRGVAGAAMFSLFTAGLVAAPVTAHAADPLTIAEIQGTETATPHNGKEVTTEPAYVTAVYGAESQFSGFVIQSPDTGGDTDLTEASDAIFVYLGKTAFDVAEGDVVSVTGTAGEYPANDKAEQGLTQLSGAVTIEDAKTEGAAPEPVTTAWADTAENRENLESMLYQSTESFLVSDTYPLMQYGELGLAAGGELPVQPTDVGTPDSTEAKAQAATNAATMVNLDDGTNAKFTGESHLPWITPEQDVTVGDSLTLTEPVIVDYRNDKWKLNPTQPITAGEEPGEITSAGTPDAPASGGDFSVASFNVLNYFTTTGEGRTDCTSANGDGNATWDCDVRGAWDGDDLARQQAKIVTAINDLDASVVGLMEIENSAVLGEEADEATQTLVDALNKDAADKWEVVPTSAQLQEAGHDDVITNALIFQPGKVELNGEAQALKDDAFANARTPIAASFTAADGGEPTLVAVNHFKSKGSGSGAEGDNAEGDDGQGAWNGDRKRQAEALTNWLPTLEEEAGTESAVLLGDFNSYSQEDPMQVLYEAGFTNAAPHDQYSYNYSGLAGSLDHVLVSEAAESRMTEGAVWNINAGESTALEYSQYGLTADNYHDASARRSSDHDPVIIGLEAGEEGDEGEEPTPGDDTLTLLNINDFHGRIAPEEPDTVAFFGTVAEQEAEAGEDQTLFLSAGDNIGASLFASSIQKDEPTIDVLNAAGLDSSAVGNHEFDKGMDDLTGRVADRADWEYTGANVYDKETGERALEPYTLHEVDGRTVAVIGTVTKETASLVSPKGIADIEFRDPVDAVNTVSAELSDGDDANGEADVIIAEYHEGAIEGQPGGTLEKEVAKGGAFAKIVNETSAEVDAIFTGHTHQTYAWDAPIPDAKDQTRPIVQTGSYGENLGKVTLTLGADGQVTAYTAENLEVSETPKNELIDTYPQVKEINDIVNEALAAAEELGKPVIGQATAPITRAEIRGEDPENPGEITTLEDRAGESTISNVVANMFHDQIDGADIGVQNPGGNREDLDEGDITFGEAASVLPFANTLNTVELTGAQFKTVLEQQWQVDENGDPSEGSRPYLQLGLSDNVSYTYDESQSWGERITSITVDGKPYDPEATYTVGTASFLASGGDNFWAFGEGANKKDTGKIDLDSWTDWIQEKKTITPSFARRAVAVDPLPSTLTAGETTTVQVGSTERATGGPNNTLDLTSQESIKNTELTATLDGAEIGTAEVSDGVAELDLAVPADTPSGSSELLLTASPSETTVALTVTVEGSDAGDGPILTTSADRVAPGDDLAIQTKGWPANTKVTVELHSEPVELRTLLIDETGRATGTVTIPEDTEAGTHELVAIAGDSEARVTITVTAADAGAGAGGGTGSGDGLADTGATGGLLAVLLLGLGALGVGGLMIGTRKARA